MSIVLIAFHWVASDHVGISLSLGGFHVLIMLHVHPKRFATSNALPPSSTRYQRDLNYLPL